MDVPYYDGDGIEDAVCEPCFNSGRDKNMGVLRWVPVQLVLDFEDGGRSSLTSEKEPKIYWRMNE